MYMLYISNSFKMHHFCENEPLKFRTYLLKVSFSRPFYWIVHFLLARSYRARIQLSFTNTRGIQYSVRKSLCFVSRLTGFLIWPSGRNTSILMNVKNGILNVPKHGNKLDLIHFVTTCACMRMLYLCMRACACMYVCLYVWACVCMNVCKGVSSHVRLRAYACMYICMSMSIYEYIRRHEYTCMYTCMLMYVCMFVCMYVNIYAQACMHCMDVCKGM